MSDKLSLLYHYTSYDTFIKIIRNATLRLSDLTKSNDDAEIIGLRDRISKDNTILSRKIDDYYWLGICFTELEDDYHMWCEYGKNGVNIGFDFDGIQNIMYCMEKKRGVIFHNKENDNLRKIKYRLYDEEYYLNPNIDLFNESAFIKGESFSIEKEWRLLIPVLKNFIPIDEGLKFNDCEPKSLDIKFDLNIIKEIVVSHSCEKSIEEIKSELNKCGLNVNKIKIIKSKITYRPKKDFK